jgi:transposase-like protein
MSKTLLQQEWDARIAEYKTSGLSVKDWCVAHQVKPHQLRYWLRKEKASQEATTPTQWLPVEIGQESSSDSLIVKVGAAKIEVAPGFNPELLSKIVRTLAQLC